jgi:nucleoside-diphosphate-sugar epimerase
MIYIIGENSFLAKNLYIHLRQKYDKILLLSHNNIEKLQDADNEDIVINFCGVNRANTYEEYDNANNLFLKTIVDKFQNKPFLIHISSLMVYGFKNKENNELINYQKWFIDTKLKGEEYLKNNYLENKLCIIRPSNIYGYNCTPYYNNLLSTLVYEKINSFNKINKININCVRNMLSIHNFSKKIMEIIDEKKSGIYNILSNNNLTLNSIIDIIYNNNSPNYIIYDKGDLDEINLLNNTINGDNIIVDENISNEIIKLENDMIIYLKLKNDVSIKSLNKLSDIRGEMIEISSLESKRLYKITLNQNVVRGNHYHYKQIEEFYTNKGTVIYLLAYSENPDIIYIFKSYENDLIKIPPNVIHTLVNDYYNNIPEIIISSTQEFIQNEIPDTKYIKIIN